MNWLYHSFPWYVSGPLIGLTVPVLLLLAGETFGISSSLQHLGSLCSPNSRLEYLSHNDWRKNSWSLVFVSGIVIGAFMAAHWLSAAPPQFLPDHYHNWMGGLKLLLGGVLIGFGTRYADGCTSGHSIMGISNLKLPSLIATIFFFVGGLFMTHVFGFWLQ